MRLKNEIKCDVLVMGAGIAGIMAAISAAEAGADVCIVSGTRICSGSSFYPGTWGLGLVGPESDGQTGKRRGGLDGERRTDRVFLQKSGCGFRRPGRIVPVPSEHG